MIKHFSFLLLCTIVLSFFVACSKDSDEEIEGYNSLTEKEKMLIGVWYSNSGYPNNLYVFADNIIYIASDTPNFGGLGYWLYNNDSNVLSTIMSFVPANVEMNINNLSYQYMSGKSNHFKYLHSYIKYDNKNILLVYFAIAKRYFGIDIWSLLTMEDFLNIYDIDINDYENMIENNESLFLKGNIKPNEDIIISLKSGKNIIIKNPLYMKKSIIIYDNTEYKFNESLLNQTVSR